ncbi:phage integrase N-terminal SAM-like domain-containing protein [Thermocoleostomius sinensis]|uniref:Phage integrase N-terminal SAM-like domain-containing protein n=1 Tax=Thermocoleostomius sinensis A174 TaxID=2016057 RepID=A0A9E8ZIG8_9CYAN|nr:phage integrase N-terminal SAM-like domain-containing protein [Thermocoleostomius sinensis]WAL59111.1 phage integrase N-terminal SAM-like domain-containing protein [Thermocoleostomius sinensis A174]
MLEPRPRKLLDQVRDAIRVKHYSYSTEKTYVYWIRRFILFHHKRHPNEMGAPEVTQFLTHLAVTEQVAAATQNQALNAIIFLYRIVLQQELVGINAVRAKTSRYLPTVLTPEEVQQVISHLYGVYKLVIQLLYGSGLRLSEGLALRVKDVDFAQQQLVIRDTKGKESRVTMLPACVVAPLQTHLQTVRQLHHHDLERRLWLGLLALCPGAEVSPCRSLQQIFMVSRQARDVAFSTQVLLSSTRLAMASRPRKLLDQVCDTIRLKHYSYRTEQSYVGWIRRYSLFHICMKVGYRKR